MNSRNDSATDTLSTCGGQSVLGLQKIPGDQKGGPHFASKCWCTAAEASEKDRRPFHGDVRKNVWQDSASALVGAR